MIYQALYALSQVLDRKGLLEDPGWASQPVHFSIEINADGEFVQMHDERVMVQTTDKKSGKKKEKLVPVMMRTPRTLVSRTNQIQPLFLRDNAQYVLRIPKTDSERDGKRADEAFASSVKSYLEDYLASLTCPEAEALRLFFERLADEEECEEVLEEMRESLLEKEGVSAGEIMKYWFVFRVEDKFVHEIPEVKTYWDNWIVSPEAAAEPPVYGTCSITGKKNVQLVTQCPSLSLMGKQASMMSSNAPAFDSYGLSKSVRWSISKEAMTCILGAINWLLQTPEHHRVIGNLPYIYWTSSVKDSYAAIVSSLFDLRYGLGSSEKENTEDTDGNTQEANDTDDTNDTGTAGNGVKITDADLSLLMRDLSEGKAADEGFRISEDEKIYIAVLDLDQTRFVIREYWEDSFGGMMENVRAHAGRIDLGDDDIPVKARLGCHPMAVVRTMQKGNRRSAKQDTQPDFIVAAVYQAVLCGADYPMDMLTKTLKNLKSGDDVTARAVSLLKAWWMKHYRWDEDERGTFIMDVNSEARSIGYITGQIFCECEQAQREYLYSDRKAGEVRMNISSFYRSMQTKPQTVWALVMQTVELYFASHRSAALAAIEYRFRDLVCELDAKIGDNTQWGKRFSTYEQSAFAFGYNAQKRWNIKNAIENKKRNEQGNKPGEKPVDEDGQEAAGAASENAAENVTETTVENAAE